MSLYINCRYIAFSYQPTVNKLIKLLYYVINYDVPHSTDQTYAKEPITG